MRIAVIGWGSLIWDPRELDRQGHWHKDGPWLPVEFARKSADGRLTLVTRVGSEPQQTYWVLSRLETMDVARANLQEREGTQNIGNIHWATREDAFPDSDDIAQRVQEWLEHIEVDAAIWTGLRATLCGEDLVHQAVSYLTSLSNRPKVLDLARQYLVKAPPQIQTQVRRAMQTRGWTDVALPDDIFE